MQESKKYKEWKRIDETLDFATNIRRTNPNFAQGKEWKLNCQRCVGAYEMRRRGYDVTALPYTPGDDYLSYNPHGIWENPVVFGCLPKVSDIENLMSTWGDGARAEVIVCWKGTNSGHAFSAEQINGETVFYDPQNPEKLAKFYFDDADMQFTTLCRIDNLQPSDRITECCKERE